MAVALTLEHTDWFWARMTRTASGCWEYVGYHDGHGYGRVTIGQKVYSAHRLAYTLTHGEIPKREAPNFLEVCHRCDNPPCCNPDHLFLGTHRENILDMHRKGRWTNSYKRQTHCKNGHPFSGPNLHVKGGKNPQRVCRQCGADNQWRRTGAKHPELRKAALRVRTSCRHGHPWIPENIRRESRKPPTPDALICRLCDNERGKRKRREVREAQSTQ